MKRSRNNWPKPGMLQLPENQDPDQSTAAEQKKKPAGPSRAKDDYSPWIGRTQYREKYEAILTNALPSKKITKFETKNLTWDY